MLLFGGAVEQFTKNSVKYFQSSTTC